MKNISKLSICCFINIIVESRYDVQMYIPRRLGIDKRRNLDKSCVQAQSPGLQHTYSCLINLFQGAGYILRVV